MLAMSSGNNKLNTSACLDEQNPGRESMKNSVTTLRPNQERHREEESFLLLLKNTYTFAGHCTQRKKTKYLKICRRQQIFWPMQVIYDKSRTWSRIKLTVILMKLSMLYQ